MPKTETKNKQWKIQSKLVFFCSISTADYATYTAINETDEKYTKVEVKSRSLKFKFLVAHENKIDGSKKKKKTSLLVVKVH